MLNPTKHTNLQYSVINISGCIIEILQDSGAVPYSELFGALKSKIGEGVKEYALYSLSFLFTLGKIEYIKDIDSFKLKQ